MARPKLDIDEDGVFKLAKLHCTNTEIAAYFDCDEKTIRRRFAETLAKGRERGKITLRRAQLRKAIRDGNTTMLIWLGKQMLGQSDKIMNVEEPETNEEYL